MGLDVTAYSHLKVAVQQCPRDSDDDGDECYKLRHVRPFIFYDDNGEKYNPFPHANADLAEQCYSPTEGTEEYEFRAGSYGGYGVFRSSLAQLFLGVETYQNRAAWDTIESHVGMPFYELVNFSDCEGAIGPAASAKLYLDFTAHRDRYRAEAGHFAAEAWLDPNLERYDNWLHAFDLSRNDGMVVFY